MFNNFFKKEKSVSTTSIVKVVNPEDKERYIAAIQKWYKQQDKKDMRRLILTGPLYTKSMSVIGDGLLLVSNNGDSDISDFWKIYNSIEKECNV